MTFICFDIAKLLCFWLNIIGYFFSLLYAHAWYAWKKKRICKEKSKAKSIKMLLNMVASVFLGNVGVIGCTLKVIVPIKQLWLCVSYIDFLISKIVITWNTYTLLWCFHTQQAKLFATFDTCARTMWFGQPKEYMCLCMLTKLSWLVFEIENWLDLFNVYVCFGSKCFAFFLLRDVFKSLKCCLDLWLSGLLDCIHICVFLHFEKLFLSSSTASWQISIDSYLSKPLDFFSWQILLHLQSIEAF